MTASQVNHKSKHPKYAVPAVEQMLDIVECLARKQNACGITELAQELEISINGVFRILKCLTNRGYTEMDPSGGYRLSTQFFTLGLTLQSRFELRRRARAHMEWLCEVSGATVQLHALREKRALVLDCVTPSSGIFLQVLPGNLVEPHASAFSKAVLAFLQEDEARLHLPTTLTKFTDQTITSKEALFQEFIKIRSRGLAYDRGECIAGIYCIGAPIFDHSNVAVAGVGVTGLTSLLRSDSQPAIEKMILDCAEKIACDIGYTGEKYAKWKEQIA